MFARRRARCLAFAESVAAAREFSFALVLRSFVVGRERESERERNLLVRVRSYVEVAEFVADA